MADVDVQDAEMNGSSQDVPENNGQQNQNQMDSEEANGGGGGGGGGGSGGGSGNGNESQNARDDERKLFVGGLSWETTEKDLREHFGQYGEIESINVKTDPNTGRSRGFAFIVYKASDSIDKVVAAGDHTLNNKKIDPKRAKARPGKIFVGGLTSDISDDEIRTFFGQFGTVVEVELPFDKQKNQRKGFCFITYESVQVVNELLKTPKQTIAGKEVDVKKATPKPDGPMGGGMGGMGGGRGGGMRGMPGGRGGGMRGRGGPKGGFGGGWGGPGGYGGGGGYDNYGGGYGGQGGYGGGGFDGGFGYGGGGFGGGGGGYMNGGRQGGQRGGKGGSGGFKQRGAGGGGGDRQPRHAPY